MPPDPNTDPQDRDLYPCGGATPAWRSHTTFSQRSRTFLVIPTPFPGKPWSPQPCHGPQVPRAPTHPHLYPEGGEAGERGMYSERGYLPCWPI